VAEDQDGLEESSQQTSGWWFGTCFFPYLGNFIIPTDKLMFFRGIGLNHQPDMVVIGYVWRHLKPSICFNMHCQRLGLQKSYGPSGTSNWCSKDAFYRILSDGLTQLPSTYSKSGKNSIR